MRINLRSAIASVLMLAIILPSVAIALSANPTGSLARARSIATTAVLSDGRVMIAGGLSIPSTTASIEIYDSATGTFSGDGVLALSEPRSGAMGVALPTGQILIAAGREDNGSGSSLRSAELFDPVTQQSSSTGMLGTRRENATATLLADGRVLIVGGFDNGDGGGPDGDPGSGALSSAEIYSPLSGMFSPTGSMSTQRERANAVLLADGRVLVVGGHNFFSGSELPTSEIYDPATGQFSQTATMPGGGRTGATTTLLTNGKVLVAGGYNGNTYLSSAVLYNPLNNSYSSTGSMSTARTNAGAILLPGKKVLLVGGNSGRFSATSSIEIYDHETGIFTSEGNLGTARASAAVTILPNGRILIAGGDVPPPDQNHGGTILASAEILDQPLETNPRMAASLTTPRVGAISSILKDGRILSAGGRNGNTVLASAEVFDNFFSTATAAGPLAVARESASSALLPDGSVIVIGGQNGSGAPLASAERFNPQTSSFTTVSGSLWQARYSAGSALLPNGHLLVVGGRNASGPLASAETFDGHTGRFRTTASMAMARSEASTVLLADGSVLVAGGRGPSGVLATAERYDPMTRAFTSTTGGLSTPRRGAMTALLPNGKVLIAGGLNAASAALASAELFDPQTGLFTATGSMAAPRADAAIVVMPDGTVLLAGGSGASATPLATTEIYDPARGVFAASQTLSVARSRPLVALTSLRSVWIAGGQGLSGTLSSAEKQFDRTVTSIVTTPLPFFGVTPTTLELPGALQLVGGGLRGSQRLQSIAGSEGSSGATTSTASNAPLLRLQRIDNQQVIYQAPDASLPWTDLEFTTPTLARFDPYDPATRMAGVYRVFVDVNGVESEARYVSFFWIEDEIFAAGFDTGD